MSGRLGFRLLADLSRSPFASHAELGRRLGVTGEAVRQRLDRFKEDGVLRGFSAIPAASVFGRRACDVVFQSSVDLGLVLRQSDVVFAVTSADGGCGVKGYVHDVLDFTSRMSDLVGGPPRQVISGPAPRPTNALGTIDLRVLRALVVEPRSSFRHLQAATGLSYRTVRSRRERLLESRAVDVQPILRPSRNGDLYHNLWIEGPLCANEQEVLDLLHDHVVLDRWDTPPSIYLFCHEDGIKAHIAMIEKLRRTPGIDQVEVVLSEEYRMAKDRVLGWIDELMAAWRGKEPSGTGQD
ncbi:MAG: hypothetical protein KY455_13800 [Euryarchaeota archaeon]|nr:hypothetical protein [Euryarchaeota archaeon]